MRIEYISPKTIKIGENRYDENVVVSSKGLVFDWKEKSEIQKEEAKMLLRRNPEMVIIGKTDNSNPVSPEVKELFNRKKAVVVEENLREAINCFNEAAKLYTTLLVVNIID